MKMVMRRVTFLFVVMAFVLGVFACAPATVKAESSTAELESRLEQLEKELQEVKEALAESKAAESKADDGVALSGKTYLTYTADLDGADKSDNAFTVDRWYFTMKKNVSDNLSLRMTSDIKTTPDGNFDWYIKYGYAEFKNLIPNASLLFGLQSTPWTGNEEKAWKYRAQRKIVGDEQMSETSADFGLALKGKFIHGDYHLLIANGEGYKAKEDSDGNGNDKDVRARVSFTLGDNAPRLSLYGRIGSKDTAKNNRFGLLLNQQISQFSYGMSYLQAKWKAAQVKSRAYSLYLNYDFQDSPWSIFGRYDNYDPEKGVSDDIETVIVGGFAYKINSKATLTIAGHVDKDQDPAVAKDSMLKTTLEVKY